MSLSWPWALLVLATVPAILLVRWWSLRRRKRATVRVASLALVRRALPTSRRWRRVVPPVLLVLGLVLLGVAAARPQHTVAISSNETTIVLALDVSGSMCSTDVDPNRLEAAEKAAADYIKAQPGGSRMGLVTFAGFATVLVPPTDDTDVLLDAVQSLTTARGTAIGQGILTSIDAIADTDPSVAPTGADLGQVATGYAADAIVLLTDGSNTAGVDPVEAAQQAAARGVRVYTIGFGTDDPAPGVCTGSQVRPGNGFPGGGFGGFGRGVRASTRRRCSGSPTRPAAPTTGPRTPTSSTTPWPICRSTSRPHARRSTSPRGSPWPVGCWSRPPSACRCGGTACAGASRRLVLRGCAPAQPPRRLALLVPGE